MLHLRKTKSELNPFESRAVLPCEHSSTAEHEFNLHAALVTGTATDFNVSLYMTCVVLTEPLTVPIVPGHKNRH